MERLRRSLALISEQLGKLSTERKLLVGAVTVILVMVLYLVARSAGTPKRTELLPGVAVAEQQRAAAALDSMGIPNLFEGGKVLVLPSDGPRARAALAEAGQLPSDKSLLFENLIASQKWTNSRQLNEQNYLIALQNELSRTIAEFRGVRSARVILDIPEKQGLVDRARAPSAAVQVATDDGRAITQGLADAIAAFVSGSRAGLGVESIRIVDSTGRQWRATTDESSLPTTYLEHAMRVEEATRKKVENLLGYIRGVVVAVTAQVDVTRSTSQVDTNLPEKQGTVAVLRSRTETVTSSSEASGSATPGVEANQTADITRGGGGGAREESTETREEFDVSVGRRHETIVDPKGHPTQVAVSVGVPRSFVSGLLRPAPGPAGGTAPAEPTEEEIRKKFDEDVMKRITETILPHVRAMTAQANAGMSPEDVDKMLARAINVTLIPSDLPVAEPMQAAGLFGSGSGGGGGGALGLPGNMVELGAMGVLGLVALTMMVVMVKKIGRPAPMPSAEELVGVPPELQTGTDLIGEASEGDAALAGIEVNESQLQSQQVLEQVGEMVKQNPDAAARLLNRWISVES